MRFYEQRKGLVVYRRAGWRKRVIRMGCIYEGAGGKGYREGAV